VIIECILHKLKIEAMILEFKIKNYLSFKEEVTFSFEATSDKNLEEYYVTEVVPGVRILKLGIVYGANASGKSNLISAFDFLSLFLRKKRRDKNDETGFVPFMFGKTKDEPGRFELIFYVDTRKYVYSFVMDAHTVFDEALYFYPGSQPALVFHRYFDKAKELSIVEFGSKIKISKAAKNEIQIKTLKNISFFAASQQVNYTIPDEIKEVKSWFDNKYLDSINPKSRLTEYTSLKIKDDERIKKFAIDFLHRAEFNITDVLFKTEFQKAPENFLKMIEISNMPDDEKKKILDEKGFVNVNTEFEHTIIEDGNQVKYNLPESLQSDGTMRYYGLSGPYYKMIQNDAFLAVDEIESSMHALLVNHFIKEFLMNKHESKRAQLLVTTHNLSLLNEKDILRKDAIWFTSKQENGSTSIYSMADFDIRKELSFYNAYKLGKFGAIPNLD
jgi:AAA15 family ATPase/GTPase